MKTENGELGGCNTSFVVVTVVVVIVVVTCRKQTNPKRYVFLHTRITGNTVHTVHPGNAHTSDAQESGNSQD